MIENRPTNLEIDRLAAVILCGGESRRMGQPKALLPFGDEALIQRVCRIVGACVSQIVVVGAPGQQLPALSAGVLVISDDVAFQGPLSGIAGGLRVIADTADAAFVCSCDVPLLEAGVVRLLAAKFLRERPDAVAVQDEEFLHPLMAVYGSSLHRQATALLSQGILRPRALLDASRTIKVAAEELRSVDPELRSLMNLNTPEQYTAALKIAGFGGQATGHVSK